MKSKKNNELDYLLSPLAIRDQAKTIFDSTVNGDTHFTFHPEQVGPAVEFVLSVIRENYPDLKIPFHSRWGHFKAGGIDRVQWLNHRISKLDPLERARTLLDLVIPSVLLDAGAGPQWKFHEKETSKTFSRSEGLGVASFHLFLSGELSSDGKSLRTDCQKLSNLETLTLSRAFQVDQSNPLVGVEGRTLLMRSLGKALSDSRFFKNGRPGNLVDYLLDQYGKKFQATDVLRSVLDSLGSIWPGRILLDNTSLGDVWKHTQFGLVPFHKLSQWMTYSLIEPLIEAGFEIHGVENLTGLAEYRNGGLILDSGVVSVKNQSDLMKTWTPDSDFIIEWRSLTIHLLDIIGSQVQKALGFTPQEFPLAKVLEGGTWWAGRRLAEQKRSGGQPPLMIQSDGTVF